MVSVKQIKKNDENNVKHDMMMVIEIILNMVKIYTLLNFIPIK